MSDMHAGRVEWNSNTLNASALVLNVVGSAGPRPKFQPHVISFQAELRT